VSEEALPQRCTCGAVLPPDALFCHKCGKPQREYFNPPAEPEEEPVPPPIIAPAPPPPAPIGFHNGLAVRIALLAGVALIVVFAVTGQLAPLRPFALFSPIAAGFLAVFWYQRRSGQRLSPVSGARLGWICGIFGFAIMTILLTLIVVMLSEPAVLSSMRDQLRDRGMSEADVNQFLDLIRNPSGIIVSLGTFLLLFTVLPAFGGAVGAKLLRRD
jgi:hypothetical protein